MVVSTSEFRELTNPREYREALNQLLKAPHNNRLDGATYLTRAPGYLGNRDTVTVCAMLDPNQSHAHGLPTVAQNGKLGQLSPSQKTNRENTLVVQLNGSFAKHCLTLEHASDGSLLTVEAAKPERFCTVPASFCDAYVAYPTNKRQARHRSRLCWRIYCVNLHDLAKVVALPNKPVIPENNVKTEPRLAVLAA